VLGRLHQHDPGISRQHPGRHGDRRRIAQYPSHGGILALLRRPLQIFRCGLTHRQIGSDRDRLEAPGGDYFDRVSGPLGLVDGEPQGRITLRPAVSSDDDEPLSVVHEFSCSQRLESAYGATDDQSANPEGSR
jgi:hypothetical protein